MGFNNECVENAIENLKKRRTSIVIGGNIGKNKITPNEKATDDYVISFNALFPYVDYFVVNVSSPNTPNLRELQEKEPLKQLLQTLQDINTGKDKISLAISPHILTSVSFIIATSIICLIIFNTDGCIDW